LFLPVSAFAIAVVIGLVAVALHSTGIADFSKLVNSYPSSTKSRPATAGTKSNEAQAAAAAPSSTSADDGAAKTRRDATPYVRPPTWHIEVDWFVNAAKANDEAAVRAFLSNGTIRDVDERDSNGLTALNLAALHAHSDLCATLVGLGADVNAVQHDGATPLLAATFSGSEELAIRFIVEFGARINSTNRSGAAPIHGAALLGQTKLLRTLLAQGADPRTRDESNITALHGAAVHNIVACAVELLRSGAERNVATVDGHTALHYACASEQGEPRDVVRALLDANPALSGPIDINALDKNNRTALHVCALRGHNESVSLLLARGADGTLVDESGVTAFYSAFPLRHSYVIKSFLEAGAPGINVGNANGETVLQWAAMYGFPQLTERLLNHSADVNQADNKGMSALHWAAAAGHDDVLRVLFERGADALAVDKHGRSLLHHGAIGGSRLAILMALSKGANINTATAADSQLTVLHLVCDRAPRGLVAELLSFGADETRRDATGRTPLHHCVKAVNEYAVEELVNAGADVDVRDNENQTPADLMKQWPEVDERKQKQKDRATFSERKRRIADLLEGKVDATAPKTAADEL
jgi:ankyrin repeat protein